jgi:RimJ/RimL family protein N-acetyltransferase
MITERGWGLWAVEVIERAPFIGFVGLAEPRFQAHFTPAVEVGWRLGRDKWGKGYATEAARAALAFGFDELGLDDIVSFTTVLNERLQRVRERIGMTHDPADDFDHPLLARGTARANLLRSEASS